MIRTMLDLFSGIGGFSLAASWCGIQTIGFSEIDPYACEVLKKHWPDVPNFGDIKNLRGVRADLVTGGFPCQPFSCAGKRRGKADDRHLWPEMLRVIAEAKPDWVLGENVPGIIGMELDGVLSDLESLGYSVQPLVVPACAVDARHRRDRVWIVANRSGTQSNDSGQRDNRTRRQAIGSCSCSETVGYAEIGKDSRQGQRGFQSKPAQPSETVADPIGAGLEIGQEQPAREECPTTERGGNSVSDSNSTGRSSGGNDCGMGRKQEPTQNTGDNDLARRQSQPRFRGMADGLPARMDRGAWVWPDENPDTPRVATGIPNRINRLRCLGNSIVPQVAYQIIQAMQQADAMNEEETPPCHAGP